MGTPQLPPVKEKLVNDSGLIPPPWHQWVNATADWIMAYGDTYNVLDASVGMKGDGSKDETAALQGLIDRVPSGSKIYFPLTANYYKITDAITINKPLLLIGDGYYSQIKQSTTGKAGLVITSNGIGLKDLYLQGAQYASYNASEKAINAYGADSSNYLDGLRIEKVKLGGWGKGLVNLQFVKNFFILKSELLNSQEFGIMAISCEQGTIDGNKINSILQNGDAYGVALTRGEVDSLVTYPRSAYITVTNNRISNIPYWQGLNTHAGRHLIFKGNIIWDCKCGIAIVGSDGDDNNEPIYAPMECIVSGNAITSISTTGASLPGIYLVGAYYGGTTYQYAEGCILANNSIYGHGNSAVAGSGGILMYSTVGAILSGNTTRWCSPNGIYLDLHNRYVNITSHTDIDAWTNDAAVGEVCSILIGATGGNNKFIIANITSHGSLHNGAKTYRVDSATGIGVKVGNISSNNGKLGLVEGNMTTYLSDVGSYVTKDLNL